jgi:hypothetical protein
MEQFKNMPESTDNKIENTEDKVREVYAAHEIKPIETRAQGGSIQQMINADSVYKPLKSSFGVCLRKRLVLSCLVLYTPRWANAPRTAGEWRAGVSTGRSPLYPQLTTDRCISRGGGGLIFNRAPALLRRALCLLPGPAA